jgi:hypothetical protein
MVGIISAEKLLQLEIGRASRKKKGADFLLVFIAPGNGSK